MSPTNSKSVYDGLPKKDRQALARELARIKREEERKRKRRNRIILRTSLIVAGVAVLAGAGFGIYSAVRATFVGPLNMLSDGILFEGSNTGSTSTDSSSITTVVTAAIQPGGTPVPSDLDQSTVLRITEYVDYASADVATFETTNGAALQSYVQAGYASLELHPVALEGPDSYSARAANAVACVANTIPDAAIAVHNSLVAKQPDLPEGGLSNDELVTLVTDAGVPAGTVDSCITGNEFSDWVTDATARAQANIPNSDVTTLTTVPLVIMDGKAYTGALDDTDALNTFITEVFSAATGATDDGSTSTDGTTDGSGTTDGTTPAPEETPAG
ncbi:MAG: hypothetical protein EPO52_11110 [Herbiconiux sp.]|uniref:DsbA family protein n=1 Tax=Herbiconiux sp. TaxID=1871186 RepID=UPI001221BABB|nr:thioredoxin domain-containing protein [Herbiconiux sp.]TAJ48651.1 MAG: hypothetical protein EPO52_11110 [Herbiconiux sp.]